MFRISLQTAKADLARLEERTAALTLDFQQQSQGTSAIIDDAGRKEAEINRLAAMVTELNANLVFKEESESKAFTEASVVVLFALFVLQFFYGGCATGWGSARPRPSS